MISAGCQYDPLYGLDTTDEPKNGEIVGTCIPGSCNLPQEITIEPREIFVDLHSDGTYIASNVPQMKIAEPDKSFFPLLLSDTAR